MSLVKYQHPVSVFSSLRDELNQLFGEGVTRDLSKQYLGETWQPHVDVVEKPDQYLILVDIPGVAHKDIKIDLENSQLSIRGRRTESRKTDTDECHRQERFTGEFFRQFTLPKQIDAENVVAKSRDGVLEISIPKKETAISKSIEVQAD
jgi:HSP20 family protein